MLLLLVGNLLHCEEMGAMGQVSHFGAGTV